MLAVRPQCPLLGRYAGFYHRLLLTEVAILRLEPKSPHLRSDLGDSYAASCGLARRNMPAETKIHPAAFISQGRFEASFSNAT
jgi:hypothetical protein